MTDYQDASKQVDAAPGSSRRQLPEQIGPYRIVRQLGEGGMGAVFEAIHDAIERRVAIKVLHPEYAQNAEFTARFFNEARAVNRIAHPGLVQVSDYGQQAAGATYIVMEFLDGETLSGRMKRSGGKLSSPEVIHLGWQLADSLAAAHAKGIVHRDLKPQNVMIVADPQTPFGERTKLLDFGIAKLTEPGAFSEVRTKTNQLMGTPTYMSPEQCEGAGRVDAKSDVYALGVMLFEMLAGRPPFIAAGTGKILGMHILVAPPLLSELAPEVPAPLSELIQQLLAKSKHQRPTMRQVVEALERLAEQHPLPKRAGKSTDLDSVTPPRPALAVHLAHGGPSSTFGLSAAQVMKPTSLLRWLGVAMGSAVCALAAVTVFALAHHSRLRGSQPSTNPRIEQPVDVTLRVASNPPGANVVRLPEGEVLGKTPWQMTQPAGKGLLRLRLHLDGHQDKDVSLRDNISSEVSVLLVPDEPALAKTSNMADKEQPSKNAGGSGAAKISPPVSAAPLAPSNTPKPLRTQRPRRIYVKPPLEK
jgi:serine/threonine-protein kinase